MMRTFGIPTAHGNLHGRLEIPSGAGSLIVIARAHHTPADDFLGSALVEAGHGVLMMELLSLQEAQFLDSTQNVPRLAQRLIDVLDMVRTDGDTRDFPLAIFASGDSTPAAIRAAAQRDAQVKALVCHGGLIDRAGLQYLKLLVAPLLMLFDADDELGATAYTRALAYLPGIREMRRVPAGHAPTADIANWFATHLPQVAGLTVYAEDFPDLN